jgi:tripartite-type tricarboxylate transporter receptor subunit TctC
MKRLICALLLPAAMQAAAAEPHTTMFVVPYPPGGGTDVTARAYAEVMRRVLKRTVIVDNRPGAGGLVAAAGVAKNGAADGSVVMLGNVVINVLSAYTYPKLQYDPVKDLAPVSLLAKLDIGFVVSANSPYRNLQEFIAGAKADSKNAMYASPSAGSLPHFFGILMGRAIGVEMLHVPYKGSPAINNDLLGGQVPSAMNAITDIVPLHKAGRLRMLATAGDERARSAPDVPTFKELGFTDIRGSSWFAMFVPAKTPAEEVARLSRAVREGGADPQVRKAIEAIGIDVAVSTPEELGRLLEDDRRRWAPVVKASGFTVSD